MSSILLPDSGCQVEVKDHGKLSLDDVMDWMTLAATVEGSKDPELVKAALKGMYPYIVRMVDSWNVPGLSIEDPASIGALPFDDAITIQEATYEAATRRQKDLKNSTGPSI